MGLLPASSYVFHAANEARFQGFALFAELLQGILWRVTGRAESANLVAWGTVPLLAWFLKRRSGVPMGLTLLALLAVPLVHAHATSAYVDLPGNGAATVLVLLVIDAFGREDGLSEREIWLAIGVSAIAANVKPLLDPIVGLGLAALFVRARPRPRVAMVLASPLVFFTPLKNLFFHGNPFFPVATHLLGVSLPGTEEPYAYAPAWLEHTPRLGRFAASVLEIGVRPMTDPHRWTVDQWAPEETGASRLGGFFGAYVVVCLACLGVALWKRKRRSRHARASAVVFGVVTLLIGSMPQSHELRYYLSWMLLLVCLALEEPRTRPFLGVGALCAFAAVVLVTREAYVLPRGITVSQLVASRAPEEALSGLRPGERICVRAEPFDVLWAPLFHGGKRYVVVEAETAEDCHGVPELGARQRLFF